MKSQKFTKFYKLKLKPANLIFTLLVCSLSLLLKAQVAKPGLPNDLDKMFVPDNNSIFSPEATKKESVSNSEVGVKHIIKFNVAMLSRSIAAFYYERRFTHRLGLEGGLGIVFGPDRIMGLTAGRDALSSNSSSISLNDQMDLGSLNKNSLFASLSFKVGWENFLDWDVFPYIALNTRYYSNNLQMSTNGVNISGSREVMIRNTSCILIYGREYFTESKIITSHDFYIGFGMRSTSFDKFTVSQVNSPQGPRPVHTKTAQRITRFSSTLIIGYVFGIGF